MKIQKSKDKEKTQNKAKWSKRTPSNKKHKVNLVLTSYSWEWGLPCCVVGAPYDPPLDQI